MRGAWGARPLAGGAPPMGIACAQQDVAHVYPLPDDPERCLEDFAQRAADHALRLAERLDHQEASVRRFMELSGGEDGPPVPPPYARAAPAGPTPPGPS